MTPRKVTFPRGPGGDTEITPFKPTGAACSLQAGSFSHRHLPLEHWRRVPKKIGLENRILAPRTSAASKEPELAFTFMPKKGGCRREAESPCKFNSMQFHPIG